MSAASPRDLIFAALAALAVACVGFETTVLTPAEPPPTQTAPPAKASPAPVTPPADPVVEALRGQPLRLTRHARCRMDCRHISSAEVDEVLREGTRDPARTRTDGPCPSHALEDHMADGRELRVVFAECADETRVVTVIDLDRDWDCACE
jgi:hypothetical protein